MTTSKDKDTKSNYGSDILAVSLPSVTTAVVFLPMFGLGFAVIWSLIFDKERSTSTACHASNFLPSVSAAIALTPQAYVWRVCISLHTLPRYLYIVGYWDWYSKQQYLCSNFFYPAKTFFKIVYGFSNFMELSALLGLTVISSRENTHLHENCFVTFMVGSMVCMISKCILHSMIVSKATHARRSKNRKFLFATTNILTFFASLYFYFRHNYYCEDGVYSMFGLCEYIVILSNIAFHSTISLDFSTQSWCMVEKNEDQDKAI